jgi:hypothetical protein
MLPQKRFVLVSDNGHKSACQTDPLSVYFAQLDRKKFKSYMSVLPHSIQNTPLFIAGAGVVLLFGDLLGQLTFPPRSL